MKLVRVTLVCSLLLLAAVPSYAVMTCSTCIERHCVDTPDSHTRCRPIIDEFPNCQTVSNPNCVGFVDDAAATAMLADWTVASISITRPASGTTVVTAPDAVAQATVPPATLQK